MQSEALYQRTFALKVEGLVPDELLKTLPKQLQPTAKQLVAKTIGRQLHNYGYLLAGLGKTLTNALVTNPLKKPTKNKKDKENNEKKTSSFKATALRKHFGSSANFMNNAYELVNQTTKGHTELQTHWNELWEQLNQPGMESAWESFLFTGFSQRYLLGKLGWKNQAWSRNFIRAARNKLDPFLPKPLQRKPIPQQMAEASQQLLEWLVSRPTTPFPIQQLIELLRVAVRYSLLPFLWSQHPLPEGLFPPESTHLAEHVRLFIGEILAEGPKGPSERLSFQVILQPLVFTPEEIHQGLMVLLARSRVIEAQVRAKNRSTSTIKQFRSKLAYLNENPALQTFLSQGCWVPQARLLLRIQQVLVQRTGRRRWMSVLASLFAQLFVTKLLAQDPSFPDLLPPVVPPVSFSQLSP